MSDGISLKFDSDGNASVQTETKRQCFGNFLCPHCEHEPEESIYIDGKMFKISRWFCKYGNQYVVTYEHCPAGFWKKMEYPRNAY